ncbi:Serine/threonine protein kinase [Planctomycetales bacterium 10988]|nr:Serine/threonine protein kinase [Planctomycetales bacterium 10988]
MTTMTLTDYRRFLLQSRLISAQQLDEIVSDLQEHSLGKEVSADTLGRHLIRARRLTSWQHLYLLRGFSGFHVGSYTLLRSLGRGGMSHVYLAKHRKLDRVVALKIMIPSQASNETVLQRFQHESDAHRSLKHPHIVRAYDSGEHGNMHYMAMEFVNGSDLNRIVGKQGPLSYRKAAHVIAQSARGLGHIHQHGLVHRDIKPANLLMNKQGVVKISDLGVVRLFLPDGESLTLSGDGRMLGTLDFLSPEQALDPHRIDGRADLYSLGCTMYFLLTGKVPFEATIPAQRLLMHQLHEPPALEQHRPDIPPEIVKVCRKLMAKRPAQRYSNAEEVAKHLEDWLEKAGTSTLQEGAHSQNGRSQADRSVFTDTAHGEVSNVTLVAPKRQQVEKLRFSLDWEAPFGEFPRETK